MKSKLFQHLMNTLVSALMAVGVIWLAPAAWSVFAQSQAPRPVAAAQEPARVTDATAVSLPVLSYQGRLLDPATGVPKPDGAYNMQFKLYTAATGGSPVWTETKSVQVSRGLFITLLGDTTAFNTAIFNGQALWLGVTVGADPEATPRQRVAPTAYSMYAGTAGSAATAASAGDATTFSGHALSEFYRGSNAVQINQGALLSPGQNEYWFTFGYPADQLIVWRVKPTVVGGKLKLDVETELGANNTVTYYLRVYNTGTLATGYQVIRVHFQQ